MMSLDTVQVRTATQPPSRSGTCAGPGRRVQKASDADGLQMPPRPRRPNFEKKSRCCLALAFSVLANSPMCIRVLFKSGQKPTVTLQQKIIFCSLRPRGPGLKVVCFHPLLCFGASPTTAQGCTVTALAARGPGPGRLQAQFDRQRAAALSQPRVEREQPHTHTHTLTPLAT
jgi:hypothetical protein